MTPAYAALAVVAHVSYFNIFVLDRIGFEPTNVAIPQEFNAYYDTTLLQCIVEKNASPHHYRDECLAYVPPPKPKNVKPSKISSPRASSPVRPKFIPPMCDGVIRRPLPRRMLRSSSMAQVEAAKLRAGLEEVEEGASIAANVEEPRRMTDDIVDTTNHVSVQSSTGHTKSRPRSSRGHDVLTASSALERGDDDSDVDVIASSSSSSSRKRARRVPTTRSSLPAMRAGEQCVPFSSDFCSLLVVHMSL